MNYYSKNLPVYRTHPPKKLSSCPGLANFLAGQVTFFPRAQWVRVQASQHLEANSLVKTINGPK